MKLNREQIRKLAITATLILVFGGGAAKVSQAQDDRNKPAPESPPSDPPSAPAESPRVESSPSSDSSSSNNSSSSSSTNDSNSGSGGSSSSSGDSSGSDRRSEGRRAKDDSSKHRGAVNGNGNRRERAPVSKLPVAAASENGASNAGRGGDRNRNRDWDGGRHRDRGHDRDRHRHRQDACYQVPAYDDTISYQSGTYSPAGGTPDDSLGAYDRGYENGLFTGANDARRGQTYDPERSHFYDDTPGYQSTMGSRDVYRQAYRDGFLRGYREGFQNWQKYFSGGVFHR